jgi:hypothetical protein
MAATFTAAAASAAGAAGAAWIGGSYAKKQAAAAAAAAREAEERYRQQVEQGVGESGALYDQAQGHLAPYARFGDRANGLMEDIVGLNGRQGQDNALGMYRSNPSAQLLGDAREDAIRRTLGSHAAAGLSQSGGAAQSLARRTSDMDLNDYYRWQELPRGMAGQGMQANALAAQLAGQRGQQILAARSSTGAAGAGASMMTGNAQAGAFGSQGAAYGSFLGQASKMFGDGYMKWSNQSKAPTGNWQTTTTFGG